MSAVAIKRNGVECYKLKKFNGVEKQNISTHGRIDNSAAPVVFLTFEENSGSTTEDLSESGTDHDATVQGTWSTVYKAAGNSSITFGSTNKHVVHTDHADFDWAVTDKWTISTYTATDSSSWVGVYVKREPSGNHYTGPAIFLNNGYLEVYLVDTWGSEACQLVPTGTSTRAFGAGVYQHIVVTYDGSTNASGFTAWVNGVKQTVANGKLTVGAGGDSLDSNSHVVNSMNAMWGADTSTSPSGLQSGGADNCAAWKGVHLTDAQAAILYNSGTPIDVRRGL
tara:strand:- start:1345 stop:2187 length:843 start_codon:yes stop_codon:yes gene_type:complete